MRRYWISEKFLYKDYFAISGNLLHHIFRVCRIQIGERFELLTDQNHAFLVEAVSADSLPPNLKKQTEFDSEIGWARVIEKRATQPLGKPRLHLALAFCRPAIMDVIVEKSVELGVSNFLPFISDRSYFRSLNPKVLQRQQRWNSIVISATQQCGRGEVMKLQPVVELDSLLDEFKKAQTAHDCAGIFAFEGHCDKSLSASLAEIKIKNEKLNDFWFFIGSEGGFSPSEVDKIKMTGLEPTSLGSQILRVETACVVLAGIIKYEFGI